jgi:hypothetical protein
MDFITATELTRKFNRVHSRLVREKVLILTRYNKPVAIVNGVEKGRLDQALEFSRWFRELAAMDKRRAQAGLGESQLTFPRSGHPKGKPARATRRKQK